MTTSQITAELDRLAAEDTQRADAQGARRNRRAGRRDGRAWDRDR